MFDEVTFNNIFSLLSHCCITGLLFGFGVHCVEYLNVLKSLIQIIPPVGVIAGAVFAVGFFGLLICLAVFIYFKRPDIIRLVMPQLP